MRVCVRACVRACVCVHVHMLLRGVCVPQHQSEAVYAVEVLLCCSTDSCRGAPKTPPKPPPSEDKGEMQVRGRGGRCRGSV